MRAVALALAAILASSVARSAPEAEAAATRSATLRQSLPADLPLDAEGIPTRPLTDAELFRLLVALSAQNEPAAKILATCQASAPYGHPHWRDCIEGR